MNETTTSPRKLRSTALAPLWAALASKYAPGSFAGALLAVLLLRNALPTLLTSVLLAGLSVLLLSAIVMQPLVLARLQRWPRWSQRWAVLSVVGVVGLGAVLRFWGLGFGLPYFEHPDEWAVADRAVRMLQTGDFNPGSFIYPTLYTYLQMAVALLHFLSGVGAGHYETVNDIDPVRFYLWGRALTALLGTGAVALTYALGQMMHSHAVGLLAALFLAVLPLASGDAHYITTDTPSMFFALLALLAICSLGKTVAQEGNNWRSYVVVGLAGLLIGLAISTKYNVVVLLVPLAVALWLVQRKLVTWGLALLVALPGVLIGFTLGTPYWLRELPLLLNDVASIVVHYRYTGHAGAEASVPLLFYISALQREAWLIVGLMIVGFGLACIRRSPTDLLLLAFVVPSLLQLSSVQVVFVRNVVPVLPVLCLLAASAVLAGVAWLSPRLAPRYTGPLLAALTAFIVAQPLVQSSWDNWLRAQPTTRMLATEWVEREAPPGTRIWLEDQTLILSERFRVQGGRPISEQTPAWYAENGFRFLVVNNDVRRRDQAQLAAFGEPTVRFVPEGRHGSSFSIYDTGFGDLRREQRTPAGAMLGAAAIKLEGYRHAGQVQAGAVLALALYWEAVRPVQTDYVVFVQLVDPQGNKLAQRDLQPLEGRRPTSSWQAGELIRDDQDLSVAAGVPPGTYRLLVGMYDAATLAAINDTGPVDLGPVEVTAP
jgi:4-amino-4-deoxy-L-arabinose transferase-like glycosyltransferase